jgi:hypothetical protein
MRRKLSLASGVAIAFLCAGLSLARDDRKDWQRTSIHLSELDYTLEDAAVTPRERAQIMDLIVAPYLERQAFSASPVGFINVSDDESC